MILLSLLSLSILVQVMLFSGELFSDEIFGDIGFVVLVILAFGKVECAAISGDDLDDGIITSFELELAPTVLICVCEFEFIDSSTFLSAMKL